MTESDVALIYQEKNMDNEEEKLISAVRKDPKAFGDLYQMYVEKVFRYLYSMTRNVQEAEDITTQTFMKAFVSFASFRMDGHFASWLFKIAHNKAMDHFRRRKNTVVLDETHSIDAKSNTFNDVIQVEQVTILSNLLETLNDEERELLRLRFLAELKFSEIAKLLGVNEVTIKKKIYRLLERLQNQVEDSDE